MSGFHRTFHTHHWLYSATMIYYHRINTILARDNFFIRFERIASIYSSIHTHSNHLYYLMAINVQCIWIWAQLMLQKASIYT